jgi:hypothetical protein
MKIAPSVLCIAGVLALASCSTPADPWVALASLAVDAPAGSTAVVQALSTRTVDAAQELCEAGTPPAAEIVQQGALGAASVRAGSMVVSDPDGPCDGLNVQTTEIVYESAAGVSGVDTVVFREFGAAGVPDRLHTASIRVR